MTNANIRSVLLLALFALSGCASMGGGEGGGKVGVAFAPPGLSPSGDASNTTILAANASTARTQAAMASDTLNPKNFGAVGTAFTATDGAMTAGSAVFTSNAATFLSTDCQGGTGCTGTQGNKLFNYSQGATQQSGTIIGYNGVHSVTLSFTASNTFTAATYQYGFDDGAAIAAAETEAKTLHNQTGQNPGVTFPYGNYYIGPSTVFPSFGYPAALIGNSIKGTRVFIDPGFSGSIVSYDGAWYNGAPNPDTSGPYVASLAIYGNKNSPNEQDAFMFTGRDDNIDLIDDTAVSLNGRCVAIGLPINSETTSYSREDHFINLRCGNDGTLTVPAIEYMASGTGDSTNQVVADNLNVFNSTGTNMIIRNENPDKGNSEIYFYRARFEQPNAGDDLDIGDPNPIYAGITDDLGCFGCTFTTPPTGYYALGILGNSTAGQNVSLYFHGDIPTSAGGGGINLQWVRNAEFDFDSMSTSGTNLTMGPNVTGPIKFNGAADPRNWSTALQSNPIALVVDGTSVTNSTSGRSCRDLGGEGNECNGAYGTVTGKNSWETGNQSTVIGTYGDDLGITNALVQGGTGSNSGNYRAQNELMDEKLTGRLTGAGTVTFTADATGTISSSNSMNLNNPASGNAFGTEDCSGVIGASDITNNYHASWNFAFAAKRPIGGNIALVGTPAAPTLNTATSDSALSSAITFPTSPTNFITVNTSANAPVLIANLSSALGSDVVVFSYLPRCSVMLSK